MISRRLTKTQKVEILEAYRAGDKTNDLAEKYNCTPNTINRTVKTLLPDKEYQLLKKTRSNISHKKEKSVDSKVVIDKKKYLKDSDSVISFTEQVKEDKQSMYLDEDTSVVKTNDKDKLRLDISTDDQNKRNDYIEENNQKFDNDFEEIAPLVSSFDFDLESEKLDFEILSYESLPDSVYMVVDKKVELDLQPISELPEWNFLPENELQRNAILLFSNQRSAKRSCSRNQRVIKIPNTSIFKLSKPYLIAKGVTRLILEDSIIGLDQ